ncbi:hypothetical protein L5F43_07915 [Aliarcobacter butzleri]|uniref:hypothetical protein n=1 Tax=Aliarcobacter butzleri TaxID=28197 RepID=UPI00125F894C|nr:hypothetical protein [Aliarcobacter butzleri]MCG3706409.1 hypothetical protein [Aliarcobacter butzleri]
MDNLLSKLELKYWYHVVMVSSLGFLLLSLYIPFIGVENAFVQKLSLGAFLIGLGEWINHPLQTKLYPPSYHMPTGGVTTGYPRNNSFMGILFDILGIALIIWGCFGS